MSANSTMRPSFAQLVKRGLAARSPSHNLAYALGRFYTVRRAYALAVGSAQRLGRDRALTPTARTLFPQLDVESAVSSLHNTSVADGLQLPEAMVRKLQELANSAVCRPRLGGPERFHYADVRAGKLPSGAPAVIGDVEAVKTDASVDELARDPRLLQAVTGYLGYRPMQVDKWLHWSFASSCSDDYRREQGQTIDYHYDVHGYNFLYISFYLSDCDERSGAHVYVERSHKEKPLRWLAATARRTDAEIHSEYGRKREHVIAAPAGTGFIEDTSCFHKALAPIDRDRLMLQLRYH